MSAHPAKSAITAKAASPCKKRLNFIFFSTNLVFMFIFTAIYRLLNEFDMQTSQCRARQ